MSWTVYALISALAAAATAILAKLGIEGLPSTLATAIRTVVVCLLAWGLVFGLGEQRMMPLVTRRSLVYLVLSGLATGVSWLAYFRALQAAPVAWVAPIDKLSLAFTVLFAWLLLGEPVSWRAAVGVVLMVAGALLTVL